MADVLGVFREIDGQIQRVGSITAEGSECQFAYDRSYLLQSDARPISVKMPLKEAPFSQYETRVFFEGLLPEGQMRSLAANSMHVGEDSYISMLSRFNNESIGALLFGDSAESLVSDRSYRPLEEGWEDKFSQSPRQIALELDMESRLSLAGAQSKAGLYCDENDPSRWYIPLGAAPSSHIVKASEGVFPHLSINEALCMLTARYCFFDVAQGRLLKAAGEPLYAVRRFDRVAGNEDGAISGQRKLLRLHQEDFCQAGGLLSWQKYEPTDGDYLGFGARLLSHVAPDPFSARMGFLNEILLCFLMGNCDNHLKNFSLLWSREWTACELSPLYDLVCTTIYPQIDREMGIPLCESRKIDDVRQGDILSSAKRAGVSEKLGWAEFEDLAEEIPQALERATQEIVDEGFPDAEYVSSLIRRDMEKRIEQAMK